MNTTLATPAWDILIGCLEELDTSAQVLRTALTTHDVNGVWDAIARQELATMKLEDWRRQWSASSRGIRVPANKPKPPPEIEEKARALVARTQFVQRINRTLTRVFLKIIDNTFAAFTNRTQGHPLTYGASGQFERATGPVFVHQLG